MQAACVRRIVRAGQRLMRPCLCASMRAVISDEPQACFEIDIGPSDARVASQNLLNMRIKCMFQFTPKYPETKPKLTFSESRGLQSHEVDELEEALETTMSDNQGEMMIFHLVNTVKEALDKAFDARMAEIEAEKERKAELARRLEEASRGTPVTRDLFLRWKANFDREQAALAADALERKAAELRDRKLSGKEIFLGGIADATAGGEADAAGPVVLDEPEEAVGTAGAAGAAAAEDDVAVDASLFLAAMSSDSADGDD